MRYGDPLRDSAVLIFQTKGLGDCLMALPALRFLRQEMPDAEVNFLCDRSHQALLTPYLKTLRIGVLSLDWRNSGEIGDFLKKSPPQAALHLDPRPQLLWKTFRHRIPFRLGYCPGRISRTFFLLSHPVIQERYRPTQSEAHYNLNLAQEFLKHWAGSRGDWQHQSIVLPVIEEAKRQALRILDSWGVSPHSFVVIHPGGNEDYSAIARYYFPFIDELQKQNALKIFLSEGPMARDGRIVNEICAKRPLPVLRGLDLEVFSEILRLAALVVAPSTGPLHLAHYLGTDTIGVFPPRGNQGSPRWLPWGGSAKSLFAVTAGAIGEWDGVVRGKLREAVV